MRELEFRAWVDKIATGVDEGFMHYAKDNSDYELISDGLGFSMLIDHEVWVADSSIKIMQYTGLKDKNDVKIFEGDIIQWGENIETVSYSDDDAMFGTETSMLCKDTMVVIGNIHESPELLK